MTEFGISVLAAFSVGLFFYAALNMYAETMKSGMMQEIVDNREHSGMVGVLLPISRVLGNFMISLFVKHPESSAAVSVSRKPVENSFHARIDRLIVAAGSPLNIQFNEWIGLSVFSAVAGTGLGFALGYTTGYPPGLVALLTALIGLMLPYIWLNDKRKARQLSIIKGLPYTLDLMTLAVESGLDFTVAIQRIVEKIKGSPLGDEFARMLHEINLGKNRSNALRDMARRIDLNDMRSVASTIIQADELGASLGPILRIQSQQVGERRSQRAEKLAMEAPVKIIFPLVFFIFPNTLLIIFGAMFLRLYYGTG